MKYTWEHSKTKTDIHEHLPTLYGLVIESKAKEVLELGVRKGESTVAFLEGVGVTGGKLTSVDIEPCEPTRAMIQSYGLDGRWEFVHADDIDFGTKNPDRRWDLIFIDSSHIYEHTKKELEVFVPLLKPGGHLVLHDTASFPQGVLKPLQEYLNGKPGWTFVNHPNCNGLGVARKPA